MNYCQNLSKTIPKKKMKTIYYHGTKADLNIGDLIEVGFTSNYGTKRKSKYIYLTETLDAATWGVELAFGDGKERIYIVEPTGHIEDDPNVTDKKFRETLRNHIDQNIPSKW